MSLELRSLKALVCFVARLMLDSRICINQHRIQQSIEIQDEIFEFISDLLLGPERSNLQYD